MTVLAGRSTSEPPTDHNRDDGRSVAVVGAGVTGLVAAYELRRRGVNVTVYESAAHSGGAIRTTHADGFLAEHGPNSFVSSPQVEDLISKLDLHGDVVEADPAGNKRYVVRRGNLLPFPLTPTAMLTTRLFSLRAKLRVLAEPLVARRKGVDDESIASFVRRRLGREVLDYAVDPFISGIFAGDPEQLSMMHAFPRVAALETGHGSISKGLMAQRSTARRARLAAETSADIVSQQISGAPRLISFVDGMQTLTDALEAAMAGTVRLGCPVRLLHRNASRWEVEAGAEGFSRALSVDAVVMATPAHVLAAMELPAGLRRDSAPIEQVEYPAVSTVTLGFRRRDVAHSLDGFGMLIPAEEKRTVLGALFNSSLFPARAPEEHVTITSFVGGSRQPAKARENTDAVVSGVLRELRDLLGVRGDPVFLKHVFWPKAIPQYTLGYQRVKDAADATERANPGLYLAGNYRNGVSVGDCIASGQQMAERVAAYLTRAG